MNFREVNFTTIKLISKLEKLGMVDWDEWSGEDWASFFIDGKKSAIISAKLPIIFILKEVENLLENLIIPNTFLVVPIDDFNQETWKIDVEKFKNQISEFQWHTSAEVINTQKMSIEDFWYATI